MGSDDCGEETSVGKEKIVGNEMIVGREDCGERDDSWREMMIVCKEMIMGKEIYCVYR